MLQEGLKKKVKHQLKLRNELVIKTENGIKPFISPPSVDDLELGNQFAMSMNSKTPK